MAPGDPIRVIVHGGMPKTGTTSFQLFMAANRMRLVEAGIFYPDASRGQHAAYLNAKSEGWDGRALREAVQDARAAGCRTILLSSEVVSGQRADGLRRIADALHGCHLSFVFAFRNWSAFLSSRWLQNCKRRDSQAWKDYLDRVLACREHIDHRFDIVLDNALESGAQAVRAVSYDRAIAECGSVIPVLLRLLDLQWLAPDADIPLSAWANRSGNRDAIELTRVLNGAVAQRLSLPQDDLFLARTEQRKCRTFFDLGPFVGRLPTDEKRRMIEVGLQSRAEHVFPAGWRPPSAPMLDRHAHLFVNAGEDSPFPPCGERRESYWTLGWEEIVGHPHFVGAIDAAASEVAARVVSDKAERPYGVS